MTKKYYALAFAFAEPDDIAAVLGDTVARRVFEKISSAWLKATDDLLCRHHSEHGAFTPQGLVYRTFVSDTTNVLLDEEEQIETLSVALQQLSRQLLIDEFGGGTGLKINIQTLVAPVARCVLTDDDIRHLKIQLQNKASGLSIYGEKSP